MLILPQDAQIRAHNDARKGLTSHFNSEMEKILNANSKKDTYWILGKVRFPEEDGGNIGKTFLEASDVKPPLIKSSFVYEVDNKRGVKTLLWVLNPDGTLRLPTLNKTLKVQKNDKKGVIV
jgi:hypothetical protein